MRNSPVVCTIHIGGCQAAFAIVFDRTFALNCVAVSWAQAANEAALLPFGGYEGLGKITRDFVERVLKNPRISLFFKDANTERARADSL